MFSRLKQEIKRLLCTRRTWLLIAVVVLGPVMTATDFFGLGSRVYGSSISNVLMLNPARLSLYISAFFLMVFTLWELKQLYAGETYILVESATNPLHQILIQTVAICLVMLMSVLASMLILCPYTALTMKELFSLAKFLRTWAYVYALGMLITILLTSGVFMLFRNLEASLILVSALMLFSITRPAESNFLTFWLQTSVDSLTDGTESLMWFKIMLYTRLVWMLGRPWSLYFRPFMCAEVFKRNTRLVCAEYPPRGSSAAACGFHCLLWVFCRE